MRGRADFRGRRVNMRWSGIGVVTLGEEGEDEVERGEGRRGRMR